MATTFHAATTPTKIAAPTAASLSTVPLGRRLHRRGTHPLAEEPGQRAGVGDHGQGAVLGERHLAALLADRDHQRVGDLGQADGGGVAGAEAHRQLGARQRQERRGGEHALAVEDHRAVVQRRGLLEQRLDERPGELRADGDAPGDVVAEAIGARHDDQRPEPLLGQREQRLGERGEVEARLDDALAQSSASGLARVSARRISSRKMTTATRTATAPTA